MVLKWVVCFHTLCYSSQQRLGHPALGCSPDSYFPSLSLTSFQTNALGFLSVAAISQPSVSKSILSMAQARPPPSRKSVYIILRMAERGLASNLIFSGSWWLELQFSEEATRVVKIRQTDRLTTALCCRFRGGIILYSLAP